MNKKNSGTSIQYNTTQKTLLDYVLSVENFILKHLKKFLRQKMTDFYFNSVPEFLNNVNGQILSSKMSCLGLSSKQLRVSNNEF